VAFCFCTVIVHVVHRKDQVKVPPRTHQGALRRGLPADLPVWLGSAGAAALGVEGENVRLLASWAAIDEAVARWRGCPARGRAS
jgi:hypothetical protein